VSTATVLNLSSGLHTQRHEVSTQAIDLCFAHADKSHTYAVPDLGSLHLSFHRQRPLVMQPQYNVD
jgi:hypothetical protein